MPPPFSDNDDPFLDMLAGARGMYGNVGEPMNVPDLNFGELGGIGQYFNNPLAIIGTQLGLNWAFGQTGLMPAQFSPGRNLYDQYEDKRYWASRMQALGQAAQADRATYVQALRGIAQMRGTPWGLEQQRGANVIAGDVAMMAPILSMAMPEIFDAVHGSRGSATVMAQFLHRGGRFGVDPVTGRTGLGAETVGALAQEVQSRYFAPGQDLSGWRGLRMGQAGALYEELQNRGMMGRSIGTYGPREQLDRIIGSREGREGFVRRLAEEQPEEFARLRGRAEAAQPGFVPDLRDQDESRQLVELLRGRATAAPVLDALRQGDPRLADIVRQRAGAPAAPGQPGGIDPGRLAADPHLLQAVVQAVRATMPEAELRRLVGDRAGEMRAAGAVANLTPAEQVRRLATTDETARQALESVQRADPAAYNAIVDRFDRGRRGPDRVAALALPQQVQALAQDPAAAGQAVEEVRRRDPAQFARLGREADRVRPGGSLAGLAPDEQVRRIAEAENVTAEAIRSMQQAQPGRFEALLRRFDAGAIARRMRDMAGAVGAMREIFGDAGRPNAPMSELIEGINMLTQGGMATMNPADLERMVRTTRVLSRQTGMGLNAMMGMAAEGAAVADRLGLDRAFVMPAQHSAAAFGAAFGQVGRGDLAAWGRLDRNQLTLMDQQLRLRAAQSMGANQLGAAMRLVEAQQGAGIAVAPGLQAMAQAIREGRTEFAPDPARPDQTRSLLMSEGQWRNFMAQQGVQPGMALQFLRAGEENQRPIAQLGIQNIVRAMQPQDVRQFMAQSFRAAARTALRDSGMGDDQAARLSATVGAAQAQALLDMPVEQRTDTQLRNRALGDVARRVLTDAGIDPAVAGRFQGDIQAEAGWGNLGRAIPHSAAFAGYRTQHGLLDAQSREVLSRQRTQMEEAAATVQMQTAVAELGQAGPIQRFMDMIQNPPADLGQAVGQVFGGVNPDELRRRVLAIAPGDAPGLAGVGARDRAAIAMQEFIITFQQFERVRADRNLTPEQRRDEMRNLGQRAAALRIGGPAATAQVRQVLERAGVVRPGEDIAPALEQIAQNPAAFPQLSEADRRLIGSLRAVGGGTDPAAARAETDRILAARGLRPEQLGQALAGELGVPEEDLNRLRALQGEGIRQLAPQAGIAIGAAVGPRQFDDVRSQATYLAQDLGGDVAGTLPADATPERIAEARRHAENTIVRGEQSIDALLGSAELTRSLGAGGFELAKGVRDKQKEMALIARDLGASPAEVLARGDRKDERVKQFLALHGEVQAGLGKVSLRLAEPGQHGQMTQAEEQAHAAYRAEETRGDDEKNREAVERALGADVMAGLATPEQRQEAAQRLGAGAEGEFRRRRLGRALGAREQLLKVGKAKGMDFARLRDAAAGRVRGLSAAERAAVTENIRRAGALGEGVGPENLRQFLDTLGKPPAAPGQPGDPGKPQEITLRGKLDLQNGQLLAQGEAVTPLGATPAVA